MKKRFGRLIETLASYDYKTINYRLIIWVVGLTILGINVISSATDDSSYVKKQVIGMIIGVVLMIVFALVKYEYIVRYYWMMYFANFILMLIVTFWGTEHGGAKRWIQIGSFQLQVSELSKILLLIFFAAFLTKNQLSINSPKFLILTLALFAIPLALVLIEPDLSTSIVIFVMFCVIILMSAISSRIIRRVLLIAVPLVIALVVLIFVLPADKNILKEYQYNRIVGFYDEDNENAEKIRYQQENAVVAIASGSVTGKGLHNNSTTSVKNAEYISEPHTDFIFAIVGEELGFLGSVLVVLLLGLIVFECFLIGSRARENIGKTIAVGYGSMIGIQAAINLAVVTMLIPNTGLTLPFVSYGLSSLVTLYAGIGIVLNIGIRKKRTF